MRGRGRERGIMGWSKSIVHWRDGNIMNVSVPFTWMLPQAHVLCQWNKQTGLKVVAGGPAVDLMPDYLVDVTDESGGQMWPLPLTRHNPDATFTTRGCIRRCPFCAVPRIEGEFRELADWTPAPIVCDNNLLAASRAHFDKVIDKLKVFKGVDFNQGLDCRLLTAHHLDRLTELPLVKIRFAWDNIKSENIVMDAINRTVLAGIPSSRLNLYVLIGYDDTPADALYRCETLKGLGATMNVQRYQPLTTLKRNEFVGEHWTAEELRRFCRFWNRQAWLGGVKYEDYEA